MKVLLDHVYLQFRFVFWLNNIGAKAAHKMLVKLTPGEENLVEKIIYKES
jgi:hypothetical protein